MQALSIGTIGVVALGAMLSCGEMVLDSSSCSLVTEEECGLCHTLYMEHCITTMLEERRPRETITCREEPRFEEKCHTIMENRELEDTKPVCELKTMNQEQKSCILTKDKKACWKVMKCKLLTKMIKKQFPRKDCKIVETEEKVKKCYKTVKMFVEKVPRKQCSFQPKTMCHDSEGSKCRMVKKMMCNYVDSENPV